MVLEGQKTPALKPWLDAIAHGVAVDRVWKTRFEGFHPGLTSFAPYGSCDLPEWRV
jgi:hypothetical protein